MSTSANKSHSSIEIVHIAELMLMGKLGLIEGARQIERLRFATANPDDEAFMIFRAVASETDEVPIGTVRDNCSAEFLSRIDQQFDGYLKTVRETVFAGCEELIRKFGPAPH